MIPKQTKFKKIRRYIMHIYLIYLQSPLLQALTINLHAIKETTAVLLCYTAHPESKHPLAYRDALMGNYDLYSISVTPGIKIKKRRG